MMPTYRMKHTRAAKVWGIYRLPPRMAAKDRPTARPRRNAPDNTRLNISIDMWYLLNGYYDMARLTQALPPHYAEVVYL